MDRAIESSSPFGFLLETIPMIRLHLLADEHPKSIAIVLSTWPPEAASETMKGLDSSLRFSVLKRLCEIEEIEESEIAELRFALKLRFQKLLNSRQAKSAGMGIAANMLSCSDPDIRESLLAYVRQADPDLAHKLQRSVFKIERLESLTSNEIKTILRHVDTACWAPALKNAPTSLISKILGNMAPGPAEILNHEIAEIGHIDENVEELARQNIIQVVLGLAREGKVELRKNGPREPRPNPPFPQVGQTGSSDATSFIN
jgi:flagellar motor switch protein FliG